MPYLCKIAAFAIANSRALQVGPSQNGAAFLAGRGQKDTVLIKCHMMQVCGCCMHAVFKSQS